MNGLKSIARYKKTEQRNIFRGCNIRCYRILRYVLCYFRPNLLLEDGEEGMIRTDASTKDITCVREL